MGRTQGTVVRPRCQTSGRPGRAAPDRVRRLRGSYPEGNYGAGAVALWDRGRWVAIEDPEEGFERGKLLFDLWGHKLRGRWTLFRTKGGEGKQWLMVKKPDAYADPAARPPEASVLSGLTVEELRDRVDPAPALRRRLARRKLPRNTVDVMRVEPMLAETRSEPFTHKDWVFEMKYDGYRLLAGRTEGGVRLRYRRGGDATALFPEIVLAVSHLPYDDLVLDGELVVLDPEGRPSFQRLQRRVQLKRPGDVQRATVELPATLFPVRPARLRRLRSAWLAVDRAEEVARRPVATGRTGALFRARAA